VRDIFNPDDFNLTNHKQSHYGQQYSGGVGLREFIGSLECSCNLNLIPRIRMNMFLLVCISQLRDVGLALFIFFLVSPSELHHHPIHWQSTLFYIAANTDCNSDRC